MKIRYYSELLNKEFDNKAECEAAEAKYNEAHEAEIQREKERKALYDKITTARKEYNKLVNEYNEKYHEPYRYNVDNNVDNLRNVIRTMLDNTYFAL